MSKRRWTKKQLEDAVSSSVSNRQVLKKLNLKEAGGNYTQIKKYIKEFKISTNHFMGQAWNKGRRGFGKPRIPLSTILMENSNFQSFKLKKRLFAEKLKSEYCEHCGWAKKAKDGRIPLELDHINGINNDNRIENLRILCPNCHSLQPTHRGKNIKKAQMAERYTRNT